MGWNEPDPFSSFYSCCSLQGRLHFAKSIFLFFFARDSTYTTVARGGRTTAVSPPAHMAGDLLSLVWVAKQRRVGCAKK